MDVVTIVLNAAKAAKVSGILLLAICSHESNNFTMNHSDYDHGSPSFGACQVKEETSRMLGFKGKAKDLDKIEISSKYAALYLKYEQERYGENDWCVLTASYNSGSYFESKYPGYPRNIKYVRKVQMKLPDDFKDRLSCGNQIASK